MFTDSDSPSISQGASIELKGLTKKYSDVVVDGIDLSVSPGEFITLLGPSGSGKTTTLNMIAGFTDVSAGQIWMDDRPIDSLPPYRRNIGMVFQHYALFPHMTVKDNISYPLKQRRIPKNQRMERTDAALATVGLSGFEHRMPSELSGGQQQRVALARATVYGPQVLLMDEPLGALDKKLRESLQLEIKQIHESLGTTFIYVTHDQQEALVLSDRIAVFNGGRIEQIGSGKELYENPNTTFVGQFLGESTTLHGIAVGCSDEGTVVQTNGINVRAVRGQRIRDGAVTVLIRPEQMRVLRDADDSHGENILQARVVQEIYLGNGRRLELLLPDGGKAVVRETADDQSEARRGDEVSIAFRPEVASALV